MDEYLVARLSSYANQVLLVLLLAREGETRVSQAEFANRTGLARWSVGGGLYELESGGLTESIPHDGALLLVSSGGPAESTPPPTPVEPTERIPDEFSPDASEVLPQDCTSEQHHELTPLAACRQADLEAGKDQRARQVQALQAVWDQAFPVSVYPYQRLTADAAARFLVGRDASWVGRVILDAVGRAKEGVRSPRAFVKRAIETEEIEEKSRGRSGAESSEEPIDRQELLEFTRWAKAQYERQREQEREHARNKSPA